MMDMVEAAKAAGESTKGVIDKYMELQDTQDFVMQNARTLGKLRDSMLMITWRPYRALRLL